MAALLTLERNNQASIPLRSSPRVAHATTHLPNELLLLIFHYVTSLDDNFPAIAAVTSKRWRALALSEPKLWASI